MSPATLTAPPPVVQGGTAPAAQPARPRSGPRRPADDLARRVVDHVAEVVGGICVSRDRPVLHEREMPISRAEDVRPSPVYRGGGQVNPRDGRLGPVYRDAVVGRGELAAQLVG